MRQWQDAVDSCTISAAAESPLPVSTRARASGPDEQAFVPPTNPETPHFIHCKAAGASSPTPGSKRLAAGSTSVSTSVDVVRVSQTESAAPVYSLQDGRVLSPATRALLSMLQGPHATDCDDRSLSQTADPPVQSLASHGSGQPPTRSFQCNSPVASMPPPPSPSSKADESSLSPDEMPLRLRAHPVSYAENYQATPAMICDFLQLTLNEPPSSTKINAETDFLALAKQQLFVSELPTPPNEVTPEARNVGVSIPSSSGTRMEHSESSKTNPSAVLSFTRRGYTSHIHHAKEQEVQQCGGLVSPLPCHSSAELRSCLVDAATSPGTPLCPQKDDCAHASSSSKAASEKAAVELCESPEPGLISSPWQCTPVCLQGMPMGVGDRAAEPVMRPDSMRMTPLHAADASIPEHLGVSPGPLASNGMNVPGVSIREAPRLSAMGNALSTSLSPLLRDACGRSAKSVLKDLLAELVEQERALDAQGSTVKAEYYPMSAAEDATNCDHPHPLDDFEETVDVVVGSPLRASASQRLQMESTGSGFVSRRTDLDILDPLTFDAVYDEAVVGHLAEEIGEGESADQSCPARGHSNSQVHGLSQQVSCSARSVGCDDKGLLLEQEQPVSPAMTRVSTFSVRSALSSDVGRSQRLAGSEDDVAMWMCPSELVSRGAKAHAKVACRTKERQLHARQAAAKPSSSEENDQAHGYPGQRSQKLTHRKVDHSKEAHAHVAPAWRPACGPMKGASKRPTPAPSYAARAATASAVTKRPTYDAYEYFERKMGPPKGATSKNSKATSTGQYAALGRSKGSAKGRLQASSRPKQPTKNSKRSKKPQLSSGLAGTDSHYMDRPAAVLAARMGYDMEYPHLCTSDMASAYESESGAYPPQNPFANDATEGLQGLGRCKAGVRGKDGSNGRGAVLGLRDDNIQAQSVATWDPEISDDDRSACEPSRTAAGVGHVSDGGFTFSASQQVDSHRKSLASLPGYAEKRRKQSRESLPHDSLLFVGFSSWFEVSFFTLKDVSMKIPQVPGIYEWGAMPPGTHTHNDILAFYLGKAGTHDKKGSQGLATRFKSGVLGGHRALPKFEIRPGTDSDLRM